MSVGRAAQFLDGSKVSTGDNVKVVWLPEGLPYPIEGSPLTLEGTVMELRDRPVGSVMVLKLGNGYNVGLSMGDIRSVESTGTAERTERTVPRPEVSGDLPTVALIGTGGTIASYVDRRTGAVHPARSEADFLYVIPELSGICRLEVTIPMSKLSEDITPDDWIVIADHVIDAFRSGARGVVIAHGTDTMAYTAAALSFTLRDLPGPVVLTGSQRSSDRPSSDSYQNLLHSMVLAARSDIGEVCVLMHATMSDGISAVHRGNRVRKMHTSRRDAFRSINSDPIGTVSEEGIILNGTYRKGSWTRMPWRDGSFSREVAMLQAHPALDVGMLVSIAEGKKALVISGTGLGHMSSMFFDSIRELRRKGLPIVMASSCLNGRVNLRVYSTGRDLMDLGVIGAGDLTPETALVKAMWCLGKLGTEGGIDADRFRELYEKDIALETNDRTSIASFHEHIPDEGPGGDGHEI